MSTKPRCMIQSQTPGQATNAEAVTYLREAATGIADRISAPAQDHGYNCLSFAAKQLHRLALVEQRCEKSGHQWLYQPALLLMYPPQRNRMCERCGLPDMVQADLAIDGRVVSDPEWEAARWGKKP